MTVLLCPCASDWSFSAYVCALWIMFWTNAWVLGVEFTWLVLFDLRFVDRMTLLLLWFAYLVTEGDMPSCRVSLFCVLFWAFLRFSNCILESIWFKAAFDVLYWLWCYFFVIERLDFTKFRDWCSSPWLFFLWDPGEAMGNDLLVYLINVCSSFGVFNLALSIFFWPGIMFSCPLVSSLSTISKQFFSFVLAFLPSVFLSEIVFSIFSVLILSSES